MRIPFKKLFLLLILFFNVKIKADEAQEHSTQDFLKAFDSLYASALNNVFQDENSLKELDDNQKAFIIFGKQRLEINRSAILKLTSYVLNLEKSQLKLFCKKTCPHCRCHESKMKHSKWPIRIMKWALSPLSLVKDIFQDPIALAIAPSIRLTREYGALTFSTIVLSQISWEIIESMASIAIGAGGAHLYCVAFNIALMSIVKSASSSLGILTKFPYQDSIFKRLSLALKNLAWGLRYTGSIKKNILVLRNGIYSLRKRDEHRKYNSDPTSINQRVFEESGLFAAEIVSSENIYPSKPTQNWSHDWNNIAHSSNELEKWVLLKIHIQGLESMGILARETANSRRKEKNWSNYEYLKFHSQLGRWFSEVKNLETQAIIELQHAEGIQKWAIINGLAEAERLLFLEINKLMSVFRDKVNLVLDLNFKEFKDSLLSIRKNSCEGRLF